MKLDGVAISNGFNFGLGAAIATTSVAMVVGAVKAAWAWQTTSAGASFGAATGLAVAGLPGAAVGGALGGAAGFVAGVLT